MLPRIVILLAAVAVVVMGSAAVEGDTGIEPGADREAKLHLPHMFQIITFDNNPCRAKTGEHGTCFSQKECDGLYGSASGTCANGFGVCCVLTATCGQTISVNNTYFVNPDYPAPTTAISSSSVHRAIPISTGGGTCMVNIEPPHGTCQILLQFDEFELAGPWEGDCMNDTFQFSGANPGRNIPVLCGSNSGQHMYIDVDNSDGPFKLIVMLSNMGMLQRRFKIKVSFIEPHNPCKAPNRCLQYYKETSGSFSSFNFHGTPPMMLNDQNYAICFAYVPGFCDIGINFNRLDLGNVHADCGEDYLGINNWQKCGDFNSYSVTLNDTAPAIIQVVSGQENDAEQEGFHANYMMMPCH